MTRTITRTQRSSDAPLTERQRQFASLIWRRGPVGRREIHQFTGVHPTLTGNAVAALIAAGLIREGVAPPAQDRGRPLIPVEVDPDRRLFLGLAFMPGMVRLGSVDPTGATRGSEIIKHVSTPQKLIQVGASLLAEHVDDRVYSVGISFTGVVDPKGHATLFSSSMPAASPVSLQPLYDAAGSVPVILNNDMHALALRWLLTSGSPTGEVLLVGFDDGRLGASLLIDGVPYRGSVMAASELGHMRLAVPTEKCYCGQEGCLERILSTPQVLRLGAKPGRNLDAILADVSHDRAAIEPVLDHFVTGLANAVNFIRPTRLVLASPLVLHESLRATVLRSLPSRLIPGLREQVQVVFIESPNLDSTENAAWLALADVFGGSVDTTSK